VGTGMGKAVALVPAAVPTAVELCDAATAAHIGWTAFYRHEYPRLASALFAYTGDREVGRELAQEAMARAWQHWARIAEFENPAAWTCRVAMNLANSTWRRMLLSRRVAHRVTEEASAEPDIHVRLAVRQAVAGLPRRQRTAVVLRYFVDLPVEDVARLMGCRPGTVTAMTVQAIAKLRDCVGLAEHEHEGKP
jgi:RNA polymerase sigma factor (sigma-70 family)